ncbi:hypothetical protein [Oceaniglobus roseus]|uniref:hypothetical protein n=1 Tax=Oceaniglobus roseus TaxID=1737570 RepID=UPI000C7EDFC1|nr:hypothetical protein [Kandeliimicrobium roseum]
MSGEGRTDHAIRTGALALAGLCTLLILATPLADLAAGGEPWHQGDWLINDAGGTVRRGPFGAALIALADLAGLSPVALTVAVQAALVLVAMAALLDAFARALAQPVWALLLTSPAFFPLFWAARPEAGLRKELLVFAAMALLLPAAGRDGRWRRLAPVSAALFLAACVGHEANVFLLPAYGLLAFVALRPDPRAGAVRVAALVVVGGTAAAFLFAWAYRDGGDPAAVCAALTARGASPRICIGAIEWLGHDIAFARDLLGSLLNRRSGAAFLLASALAGLPLIHLVALHDRWRLMLGISLLLLLPILPLFAVAVDWGRWMALHVASAGLVLLALRLQGVVRQVRPARPWLVAAICVANLFWVPDHVIGWVPGGLVAELAARVRGG